MILLSNSQRDEAVRMLDALVAALSARGDGDTRARDTARRAGRLRRALAGKRPLAAPAGRRTGDADETETGKKVKTEKTEKTEKEDTRWQT